jgi:small GTP-binding protein
MGLFDRIKRRTNLKTVICGLDNSGKTTIVNFLKEGRFVPTTPTMGKEKQEIIVAGTKLELFDMGGQSAFRSIWLGELKDARCVLWVIDRSDLDRIQESRKEFEKILPMTEKYKVKILIAMNKVDKPGMSVKDIIDIFELHKVDNFEIMEVSAMTGKGMVDLFTKFYSILTGKVIKKNIVAKAITIYDDSGIPLVINSNDAQVDQRILEGGFLSAITAFANMRMAENTNIKFESQDNGTFVIMRSNNYIGALLWTSDLDTPLDYSEDALKDLLEHLENTSNGSKDDVELKVAHYATNLM